MKNDKKKLNKINNWAVKNPKTFWLIGIVIIFIMVKVIINITKPNPTWCDCDKAAGEAIEYSLFQGREGSSAKYDERTVEACAEKVLELNSNLDIDPEDLSIEYILQFSGEICTYGYYEGKGSDNRGKRYYPKKD
jgi:hypothetical protein